MFKDGTLFPAIVNEMKANPYYNQPINELIEKYQMKDNTLTNTVDTMRDLINPLQGVTTSMMR